MPHTPQQAMNRFLAHIMGLSRDISSQMDPGGGGGRVLKREERNGPRVGGVTGELRGRGRELRGRGRGARRAWPGSSGGVAGELRGRGRELRGRGWEAQRAWPGSSGGGAGRLGGASAAGTRPSTQAFGSAGPDERRLESCQQPHSKNPNRTLHYRPREVDLGLRDEETEARSG